MCVCVKQYTNNLFYCTVLYTVLHSMMFHFCVLVLYSCCVIRIRMIYYHFRVQYCISLQQHCFQWLVESTSIVTTTTTTTGKSICTKLLFVLQGTTPYFYSIGSGCWHINFIRSSSICSLSIKSNSISISISISIRINRINHWTSDPCLVPTGGGLLLLLLPASSSLWDISSLLCVCAMVSLRWSITTATVPRFLVLLFTLGENEERISTIFLSIRITV